VIEGYRLSPKHVVYWFYWNDIQNNVSSRNIHTEADIVVHKPILYLGTNEYRKAEHEKNDVTSRYAPPDATGALLVLASQSKFLCAAGRVLKYDMLKRVEGKPRFPFDEVARKYLEGNLDHFVGFLRASNTQFVLVHIPG